MSAQLAQLQEDRAQYQEQLDLVLVSLNDDPGNDELLALKAELQSALEIIDDSMAELKPEASSKSTTNNNEPDSQQTAAPESAAAHGDVAPTVYKVNESILARWVTGDKAYYPARIMSVTGSATAPMYTVKFKSYDTIETLRARDIRPIAPTNSSSSNTSAATKRKADSSSVGGGEAVTSHRGLATPVSPTTLTPPPPPPPPSSSSSVPAPPQPPQPSHLHGQPPLPPPPPSVPAVVAAAPPVSTAIPPPSRFRTIDRFSQGVVSSASPQMYAQPAQQQQQQQQWSGGATKNNNTNSGPASNVTPLGDEPPVKKFKKIKATKQLEAGKSKWQEFSSKGKAGKPGTKKDSMFRTPDGPQGRVGFIGSGQAMRKDVTRSRHIYQTNDDVD